MFSLAAFFLVVYALPAKAHELLFACTFGQCRATGNVCADLGSRMGAEGNRCDRNKDDGRIHINCSDGVMNDDRVLSQLKKENGRLNLFISRHNDRNRMLIETRDFEGDGMFASTLSFPGDERKSGICRIRIEQR